MSSNSREVYLTLHSDLQYLIDWAFEHVLVDITLVQGHRSPEEQFELYKKGREEVSEGTWVIVNKSKKVTNIDGYKQKSNHNYIPSHAVDICAYVPGKGHLSYDMVQLGYIGGAIISHAEWAYNEGIIKFKARWGNDWDRDGDFSDNSLVDAPHIELYIEKAKEL